MIKVKTTMSYEKSKAIGRVSVTIWNNETSKDKGERKYKTFTVQKSYLDDKVWKQTNTFTLNELKDLHVIIDSILLDYVLTRGETAPSLDVSEGD